MSPRFREDKTTQAAAILLQHNGGRMYYLKLIKLLYLADRKSLELTGFPITFDRYVSMDFGPVLSSAYDLIKGVSNQEGGIWNEFISPRKNHEIHLIGMPSLGALSEAEIEILNQVFDEYGHLPRFSLVELSHQFPEYHRPPKGSILPITYRDILKAMDEGEEEINRIENEISFYAMLDS